MTDLPSQPKTSAGQGQQSQEETRDLERYIICCFRRSSCLSDRNITLGFMAAVIADHGNGYFPLAFGGDNAAVAVNSGYAVVAG